jgi:RHS repeat-associated protein
VHNVESRHSQLSSGQFPATTNTCAQNYKFTGYERDAETGLDCAFARYYNCRLGRFMSAGPLSGSISNPQSLNRYAYVGNNPANFVDPLGLNGQQQCKGMDAANNCFGLLGGDGEFPGEDCPNCDIPWIANSDSITVQMELLTIPAVDGYYYLFSAAVNFNWDKFSLEDLLRF